MIPLECEAGCGVTSSIFFTERRKVVGGFKLTVYFLVISIEFTSNSELAVGT